MFTKASQEAIEHTGKHLMSRSAWTFPTLSGGEVFGAYLMFMRGAAEKENALRLMLTLSKVWDYNFKAIVDGGFAFQKVRNGAWTVLDTLEDTLVEAIYTADPTTRPVADKPAEATPAATGTSATPPTTTEAKTETPSTTPPADTKTDEKVVETTAAATEPVAGS